MDRIFGQAGQDLLDDIHALEPSEVSPAEAKHRIEDFIARIIELTRDDTEVDAWRRNWIANAIGSAHLGWYAAALMALEVPLLHRDYDGPTRIHPDDLSACLDWLRGQPTEAGCRQAHRSR